VILQVTRSDFDFGLFLLLVVSRFERVLILIPFDRIISHRHSLVHPSPLRRSFFSPHVVAFVVVLVREKEKR